jgi:hypothetical protein
MKIISGNDLPLIMIFMPLPLSPATVESLPLMIFMRPPSRPPGIQHFAAL